MFYTGGLCCHSCFLEALILTFISSLGLPVQSFVNAADKSVALLLPYLMSPRKYICTVKIPFVRMSDLSTRMLCLDQISWSQLGVMFFSLLPVTLRKMYEVHLVAFSFLQSFNHFSDSLVLSHECSLLIKEQILLGYSKRTWRIGNLCARFVSVLYPHTKRNVLMQITGCWNKATKIC